MSFAYHNMTLEELERIAYAEQNTLALAILEVSEGEGIDPDDYANLEHNLGEAQDDLYDLQVSYDALLRERDTLLDKLSDLEAQFEQACVELRELRELNLEKQS